MPMDVTDPQSVSTGLHHLHEAWGRIDGLFHAAGIGIERPFLETSLEDFERILRVNLLGTFVVCRAVTAQMSQGGSIVTVASTAGESGSMWRSAYSASKAGVISLTKTIAAEAAPLGIRANVLSPGPVRTELVESMHSAATKKAFSQRVPLGRYAEPEEIANAAIFLLSPNSSYVTGHVLTVDGGFTSVPMIL
jgi:NAD(P)-dependent dehydrogenase (short-subunit alcohol dehydrogenase family)